MPNRGRPKALTLGRLSGGGRSVSRTYKGQNSRRSYPPVHRPNHTSTSETVMRGITVTTFMWGELGRIEASSVLHLSRKLYNLCPFWTRDTCYTMASKLARGMVLTVQDAEAVFLPGVFQVAEVAVRHVEDWTPSPSWGIK